MSKRTFDNGATFGQTIKAEIMEFRGRLDALEAQMRTLSSGMNTNSVNQIQPTEVTDEGMPVGFDPNTTIMKGFGPATDDVKSYSEEVMKATYLLHEAAISVRGYGMLLEQAGLSKDQKKMVHELQEGMMMVLKAVQAIKLLMLAEESFEAAEGPLGWLGLMFAGGFGASSIAYGSKLTSGEV